MQVDPAPICNLKKYGWMGKKFGCIRIIAELSRINFKKSAKIRLITNILRLKFGWLQTISVELLNVNWNDCHQRVNLLLSVSLLQNLHPSVITRSSKNHENDSLQIYQGCHSGYIEGLSVNFTWLFEYPYFFGGQKFGGEFCYWGSICK